jgi:hypothetical protein
LENFWFCRKRFDLVTLFLSHFSNPFSFAPLPPVRAGNYRESTLSKRFSVSANAGTRFFFSPLFGVSADPSQRPHGSNSMQRSFLEIQ